MNYIIHLHEITPSQTSKNLYKIAIFMLYFGVFIRMRWTIVRSKVKLRYCRKLNWISFGRKFWMCNIYYGRGYIKAQNNSKMWKIFFFSIINYTCTHAHMHSLGIIRLTSRKQYLNCWINPSLVNVRNFE